MKLSDLKQLIKEIYIEEQNTKVVKKGGLVVRVQPGVASGVDEMLDEKSLNTIATNAHKVLLPILNKITNQYGVAVQMIEINLKIKK